jgi:hypothetical protein
LDAVTRRTGLTASQRRQRSRIGALIRHSMGRTNTAAATNAFLKRFEDQVDPKGYPRNNIDIYCEMQ